VCVCAFSLRRESPDMILGDKPFIFEVVLSHHPRMLLLRDTTTMNGSMMSPRSPCNKSHKIPVATEMFYSSVLCETDDLISSWLPQKFGVSYKVGFFFTSLA
jgi:hypothetical protein